MSFLQQPKSIHFQSYGLNNIYLFILYYPILHLLLILILTLWTLWHTQ
jgi:hypothetical protein